VFQALPACAANMSMHHSGCQWDAASWQLCIQARTHPSTHSPTHTPCPFPERRFDTIYVDDNLRVAQDIRGDTLIVTRDGPPRIFT
jgi:hypothetical protein